jgi:thioesterase domain-containing protein
VPDALARALGPGWPLIELEGPAVGQPLRGPEEWVDHFRRQVESLSQPPEIILGHSWGGIVALELAGWLRSAGSPPIWVGLIDSWRPKHHPRTMGEKVAAILAELGNRAPDQRWPYLEEEGRRIASYRWGQVTNGVVALWRRPSAVEAEPEPEDPSDGLMRAVQRGWVKYTPHSIDFHVSLFTCEKSAQRFGGDPSLGWAPFLLGGFDTTRVDGDHMTLFDPDNIGSLARALERSLRRAGLQERPTAADGPSVPHLAATDPA